MISQDIDFVIPWVDGNDPEWQNRKAMFTSKDTSDDRNVRYRDWGLLRYWFRGIEKNAPWVRKIWFICDQRPPEWLNIEHPKLSIVRHEDYLPERYRPAFSSHPIELNIHRIKGLADQFVYFNDDTFMIAPMKPSDFFLKGLPRDCALLNPLSATELATNGRDSHILPVYLYILEYLNYDFSVRDCIKQHPFKWMNPIYGKNLVRNLLLFPWPRFVGFVEEHLPNAFLKTSFERAWEQDFDILDSTSCHHIRCDQDINQWFIRHRQLAEGMFIPRKPRMNCCFSIHENDDQMHQIIQKRLKPMICVNDLRPLSDDLFKQLQNQLLIDFETAFYEKSEFEL